MATQSFSKTPNIIEVSVRPQESSVNLQLRSVSNSTSVEKKSIRDIFLDDNESFEEAKVFYQSKMNDVSIPIHADIPNKKPETSNVVQAFNV